MKFSTPNRRQRNPRPHSRRGVAYFMALLLMVVMAMMAMTLSHSSVMDVRKATNYDQSTNARMAAESGLSYVLYSLRDCQSEPVLTGTPDMMQVIGDHLAGKLEGAESLPDGWSISYDEDSVSAPSISLPNGQSFNFAINVSQVDEDDNPTEVQLVVSGVCGQANKTLSVNLAIEPDTEILRYAIASTIRVIIRGNDTTINGDVMSSWNRNFNGAYPLDIGNAWPSYRSQENIHINSVDEAENIVLDGGKLKTTQTQGQFNGNEEIDEWSLVVDSMPGIRESDLRSQISYDEPDTLTLTSEDFDTTPFKNRTEASGSFGDAVGDNEKRTLPYPISNHPMLERDTSDFRDASGNYLYGYQAQNHIWISYDQNPAGLWEFGYRDSSGTWVRVERDPATDNPIGRYRSSSGYVRMGEAWVTEPNPAPDASAKIICEYWASGVSAWRAYYEGYDGSDASRPVFKNLHIPMGSNAHFKNCTFTGVTYVESDETTDLAPYQDYNKYNILRKDAPCGAGSGYTNTNAANNVVFENCTFDGPVVSSAPKDMRYKRNSAMFVGNTVFNPSAIRAELNGTTIMMPNFNVNIGDFDQKNVGSESTMVGIVLGGIVDIRDNANVEGTVVSMANLDHLYNSQTHWWGSNIGNWEASGEDSSAYTIYEPDPGQGDINTPRATPLTFSRASSAPFSPSTNLTITPDPDNDLPFGMKRRFRLVVQDSSYREGCQ